ncbi:MAG TPA: deoxyhypusine synthase [Methanoregulaceae archaeon]|nr:deoxyhypusine synthase [Methanoregulaceae archaeon]
MKPTEPVVPVGDISRLLEGMSHTGFQGRKLGESVAVWADMIRDPKCTILMGLSGAMIPAGMQNCIIELVERRYIDVLVSTGANIFHDVCEHLGIRHYIGHHHVDDGHLFSEGIDRIYDVFAYEEQFRSIDRQFCDFAKEIEPFRGSSRAFIRQWGERMVQQKPEGRSVLSSAVKNDVPVFIPALCDSSIGIGLLMARRDGTSVDIDQLADVDEIAGIVERSGKTGVVYIGGGVPKNFIQQTQVIADVYGGTQGGHAYAVQYTTDAPHWGGLSGCTFEEAISWGKEAVHSPRVQCFCDATIALPLVTAALIAGNVQRVKK